MVAVLKPQPVLKPHPVAHAVTSSPRPRRRSSAQRFPQLGFVAAGGSAVFRVAGNGLLGMADDLAFAALDRADDLALRTGPLRLLGIGPTTVARVAWTASSDLVHDLITAA